MSHTNDVQLSWYPRNRQLTEVYQWSDQALGGAKPSIEILNLALSGGAACDSGALEPSKTLQVIGLSREEAASTLRVGLHRFNTSEELQSAALLLEKQAGLLSSEPQIKGK